MSRTLILSEGQDRLLYKGLKTQTRRLAKAGDTIVIECGRKVLYECRRVNKFNLCPNRVVYGVGDVIAILPGRGKYAMGEARITDLRLEQLLDISAEDARADLGLLGYLLLNDKQCIVEYLRLWDQIQSRRSAKDQKLAATNPLVRVINLSPVK